MSSKTTFSCAGGFAIIGDTPAKGFQNKYPSGIYDLLDGYFSIYWKSFQLIWKTAVWNLWGAVGKV